MKFSDFDAANWEENGQFFDTCLIPLTGLTGGESPAESVSALERLRDFMDTVERPYRGRIVTYPVFQYGGKASLELLNEVCRNVKSVNFRYAVVLTADLEIQESDMPECDLVLSLPILQNQVNKNRQSIIAEKIENLWRENDLASNVSN